mmetsp:Transcript_5600/g.9851  ORF Transcript_5600/g.9851 Transcript_5600/m.9851 type:complete len:130 (-) Transcript_5600:1702-2091(-)
MVSFWVRFNDACARNMPVIYCEPSTQVVDRIQHPSEYDKSIHKDEHFEQFADIISLEVEKKKESQTKLLVGLGTVVGCGTLAYFASRGRGALPNQIMHGRIYMQGGAIMCLAALALTDYFRKSTNTQKA